MAQQYIIINEARVYVAETLPHFETSCLGVLDRAWVNTHAFDELSQYKLSVGNPPHIGVLQRVLAHTFYNPVFAVEHRWESIGSFDKDDIIEEVRIRLQYDDDIIQQWFNADEVLSLLEAAKTWNELVMAVKCICGGHETDKKHMRYVKSVLKSY